MTIEDVLQPGLVLKVGRQVVDASSPPDERRMSREALGRLLDDVELCRALRIDDMVRERLQGLVDALRGDLDREDWIGVARMVQEGREEEELWIYRDRERYKEVWFPKSPRRLTTAERRKIQIVIDEVIDKMAAEEREKRKAEKLKG